MNRKLLLVILLIPKLFYGQIAFTISDTENVSSKVVSLLKEKNRVPSDIQPSDIHITEVVDASNAVENKNTSGFYNIYYHYHFDNYWLFKNQNNCVLYTNPLQNRTSMFKQVFELNTTKKESKKYLKLVYMYLSDRIEETYSYKGIVVPSSNLKMLKKIKADRRRQERNEQKALKKEYNYYRGLLRRS